MLLQFYGDTRVVERHYDSMVLFVDDLTSHAATASTGGLADFFTWGDWCVGEDHR
jgi:hypothetical protein